MTETDIELTRSCMIMCLERLAEALKVLSDEEFQKTLNKQFYRSEYIDPWTVEDVNSPSNRSRQVLEIIVKANVNAKT